MSDTLNTVKSLQQLKPGKPQTQSQSKSASVASHGHERVNTSKAPPCSLFERGRPIDTLRLIPVPITLPSTEITVQHKEGTVNSNKTNTKQTKSKVFDLKTNKYNIKGAWPFTSHMFQHLSLSPLSEQMLKITITSQQHGHSRGRSEQSQPDFILI